MLMDKLLYIVPIEISYGYQLLLLALENEGTTFTTKSGLQYRIESVIDSHSKFYLFQHHEEL